MLFNSLKNEKFKKKQKNPLETRFHWAGFSMPTLSKMLVLIFV